MSDSYEKTRGFRTFNIIDDFNREVSGTDIAIRLSTGRITRYLDKLAQFHGYPLKIRLDKGAEFTTNRFTS